MNRRVFVRGLGLVAATALAAPATAWNTVSAFAAPRARALGTKLGNIKGLGRGKALTYTDPASGDPAVLLRLGNGRVVAFDAVCPHAGCTVGYDPTKHMLICPCHNSVFDPARGARVVSGPSPSPLQSLAIRVDAHGNAYALDGKPTSGTASNKLHASKPPRAGGSDDGGRGDGATRSGRTKRRRRHGGGDDGGGGD